MPRAPRRRQRLLLFPGIGVPWRGGDSPAIAAVLAEVGPRLKRVRTSGRHPDRVGRATGISKSTLSRLEAGQRKPSLELLLPIAQAHQVPLDELVGAPDVGDPRIRLSRASATGASSCR